MNKKAKLTFEGPTDMIGPPVMQMMGPSKEEKDRRIAQDAYYILESVQRLITMDGKQVKSSPKAVTILKKVCSELEGFLGSKKERSPSFLFQK